MYTTLWKIHAKILNNKIFNQIYNTAFLSMVAFVALTLNMLKTNNLWKFHFQLNTELRTEKIVKKHSTFITEK